MYAHPIILYGLYHYHVDQYNYYYNRTEKFCSYGVQAYYSDGTTMVRKVFAYGSYYIQLTITSKGFNGVEGTDYATIVSYPVQGACVRDGAMNGQWVVDGTITGTGFSGIEDTDWERLQNTLAHGSGIFRDGVRDEAYVIDEVKTYLGFDGIENTDWENIIKQEIP